MKPIGMKMVMLLAVFLAVAMAVPSAVLVGGFVRPGSKAAAVDAEYYNVFYNTQADQQALLSSGMNIIKSNNLGAVVKVTPTQKAELSNRFTVSPMVDRTMVKFAEAGVNFDSNVGDNNVPVEWQSTGSQLYMVQFVAPMENSWLDQVKATSSAYFDCLGDNVAVVKLTSAQKAAVEKLPTVQWVGAYQPFYKIYSNVRSMAGSYKLMVYPFGVSIDTLYKDLATAGATDLVLNPSTNAVEAKISADLLPSIAKLETVGMAMHLPEMKTLDNEANLIHKSFMVWDRLNYSNLAVQVTGQGQRLHIQDTRLDNGHQDFAMGAFGNRVIFNQASTSTSDHGTHVASCAVGNGYDMEGWLGAGTTNTNRNYWELANANPQGYPDRRGFTGTAPEASIVFYEGLVSTEWAAGYTTYAARIFTNSWGPGTISNAFDNTGDTFMSTRNDALVFFAAGNDGPNANTISGAATGKYTMGIGASENNRPDLFSSEDNPDHIAGFSSRGPVATDNRVKPDMLAVGTAQYGSKGGFVTDATTEPVYKGSTNLPAIRINYDPDTTGDYVNYQGTSMACPTAAGGAILMRDYLVDIAGNATPDAQMMKAMLLNGAEDIGLGFPSYDQGWGRMNIENSLTPPAPATLKRFWANNANTATTFSIASPNATLKVTMSQKDTAQTTAALTTDYDLLLTSPTGVVYQGNLFRNSVTYPGAGSAAWTNAQWPAQSRFGAVAYNWDTGTDGGDDINTVEQVIIPQPETGTWSLAVTARSGGCRYAVVMSGDFGTNASVPYEVELTPDQARSYPAIDGGGENGAVTARQGAQAMYSFWVQNGGSTADTINLAATTLPGGWSIAYVPSAAIALGAGKRQHVLAYVTVSGTATPGSYTVAITGTSAGDVVAPIAKDYVSFQVDVVGAKMPPRTRLTTAPYGDAMPQVCAFTAGATNYVIVAYSHDIGMGERIYVMVSSDGGATFGTPFQAWAAQGADGSNFLSISVKKTGTTNLNRVFMSYQGYKPGVNGDNTGLTTGYRVQVLFADAPYTTWTSVQPFTGGEGIGGVANGNTYRTTFVAYYADQIHLVVEDMGYSSTDLETGALQAVTTVEKVSTNGGTTWGAVAQINPADGNYYFFPSGYTDSSDGSIVLWYYWRTSTGTVRQVCEQRYTGTWGGRLNTNWPTDNAMFVYGGNTAGGRNYYAAMRGAQSDSPKQTYLGYTDNDGTSFTTAVGPFWTWLEGDDSKYGERNVLDVDATSEADPNVWLGLGWLSRDTTNPFKQSQFTSVRSLNSQNFALATSKTVNITADSQLKGHFRTAALGTTLFYVFETTTEDRNTDLYLCRLTDTWDTAADTIGPVVEDLATDYNKVVGDSLITIGANANDWITGGSNIAAAQYRWDNGSWSAVAAADGAFSSPMEGLRQNSVSTAGLNGSVAGIAHWLEVRAQDSASNWGNPIGIQIIQVRTAAPSAVWQNATVNATGWNLVSFSIRNTAGAPLNWLFTDQANGGAGLVTWDRMMWYNPRTTANVWKQFNKNWGTTLNDLTAYNTTMGVWLNITSVGDGLICKGGTNWTTDASTVVSIKAGWNMIGFPSDDTTYTIGTLKTDCAVITMVEGYMPSATYRTTNSLSNTQLMGQGRAYWVYASADGTWTKTY